MTKKNENNNNVLRTFLLITVASAFFAAMHNGVRLESSNLHPFEIAFFRNLFGLVALAPLIIRKGSKPYHSKKFSLHVIRGIFNGISILCWFTALSLLPVAEAKSLSLAGPIFVVLGAMVFLGERVQQAGRHDGDFGVTVGFQLDFGNLDRFVWFERVGRKE